MWLVFTGCTAGLGLELVKHLVNQQPSENFVVLVRNQAKAQKVFAELQALVKQNDGSFHIIRGDNSDLSSIKSAALAISELTKEVDCLFMNAGTMGSCSLDLGNVIRSLVAPWELPYRFATGDGLIKYSSSKTPDGFEQIFQTNALSHFLLLQSFHSRLVKIEKTIWTSSNAARRTSFSIEDIEGLNVRDPYGSSKFLVNLLSTKLASDGKMSFICDPGTFSSNITLSMVPSFFKIFLLIFFFIVQPFQPKLTRSPKNAMQSILYAYNQDEPVANKKYESLTSWNGSPYVREGDLNISRDLAETAWEKMDNICSRIKSE